MKNKNFKLLTLVLILALFLSACTPVEDDNDDDQAAQDSIIASLEEEIERIEERNRELEENLSELESAMNEDDIDDNDDDEDDDDDDNDDVDDDDDDDVLLILALEIMKDIKEKDFDDISDYVGSEGLLFSPYAHIYEDSVIFSKEEVEDLEEDDEEYEWGKYDGSGEAIILDFDSYYDEFIYDQDFLNPDIIGNNVRVGSGNTIDNIHEVFEDSVFVEFHFQSFEDEFEGLDWASLRLVFIEDNSSWKLVAIVHDQWTI